MAELVPPTLTAIILKVAAPCNLNCSYCYEYNSGDSSWKTKPKIVPEEVVRLLLQRLQEHRFQFPLQKVSLVLHGGEPLLAGHARLEELFEQVRGRFPREQVGLTIQTNGTLLTPRFVDLLRTYSVTVGISLDGGEEHNALRPDLRGRATWKRAVKGIDLVRRQAPEIYGGLLAVANLNSDPVEVLEALAAFAPPTIDLLQPFYNHDHPSSDAMGAKFGPWFTTAIKHWLSSESLRGIKVRCFSEIFMLLAGSDSGSDWFGSPRPNYVVVETDGSYSLLDSLKTIGAQSSTIRTVSASLHTTPLQSALELTDKLLFEHGAYRHSTKCDGCEWLTKCKGGYLATRYSGGRKFDNPSIYCGGIKQIFEYCSGLLASRISIQ